ncbi:MAG: SOS response-associated peptidase [Pseudomonadota bacterium]
MCGRLGFLYSEEALAGQFGVEGPVSSPPRYNIAPGQPLAVVRLSSDRGGREVVHLHWGLIPAWAKEVPAGARMINARSETVNQKPAFRSALRRRRCLAPADFFYEWSKEKGKKQPYVFCRRDRRPFAIAGLWERWEGPDQVIESCTLLTTSSNPLVKAVHDRMPVILAESDYSRWLDRASAEETDLPALLAPYTEKEMDSFAVGTYVNNPKNEGPECIESLPGREASFL